MPGPVLPARRAGHRGRLGWKKAGANLGATAAGVPLRRRNSACASHLQQWSAVRLAIGVVFGLGFAVGIYSCSLPMLPILAGAGVAVGRRKARADCLASVFMC